MNYTYDTYGSVWLLSDEEEPKPIFRCLTNDFELGRKVAVFLSGEDRLTEATKQGRLLVPQDPNQAIKDKLLRVKDDYIRLLSYEVSRLATIGVTHPQFAPASETIDVGIAIRRNIADLEAKLKEGQK